MPPNSQGQEVLAEIKDLLRQIKVRVDRLEDLGVCESDLDELIREIEREDQES